MNNEPKITLWFNDQKGNTNWPYFTGKVQFPDGTVMNAQLWTNVSATGNTYYSGKLRPIEAKETTEPQEPQKKTDPKMEEIQNGLKIADKIKNYNNQLDIDFCRKVDNHPTNDLEQGTMVLYWEARARLKNNGIDYLRESTPNVL